MTERRIDRRHLLAGAGVAGVGAALGSTGVVQAASGKNHSTENSTLIGTWLGTFTTTTGENNPPFAQILTFIPGGGVVGSGSLDLVPPYSGPQYGVWVHSGGDQYRLKLLAFAYGNGTSAGTLTGQFTFVLQTAGTLAGSGTVSITDPSGSTQQIATMTFQMTRQTA